MMIDWRVLVVAVLLLAGFHAWQQWVQPWWRRQRELTHDYCAVCDCRLRRGGAWEVRYNPQRAEDGFGGTFLSLSYCRKDRPADARRAP